MTLGKLSDLSKSIHLENVDYKSIYTSWGSMKIKSEDTHKHLAQSLASGKIVSVQ